MDRSTILKLSLCYNFEIHYYLKTKTQFQMYMYTLNVNTRLYKLPSHQLVIEHGRF